MCAIIYLPPSSYSVECYPPQFTQWLLTHAILTSTMSQCLWLTVTQLTRTSHLTMIINVDATPFSALSCLIRKRCRHSIIYLSLHHVHKVRLAALKNRSAITRVARAKKESAKKYTLSTCLIIYHYYQGAGAASVVAKNSCRHNCRFIQRRRRISSGLSLRISVRHLWQWERGSAASKWQWWTDNLLHSVESKWFAKYS